MIEPGTSTGGVPFQLENVAGTIINPATEDTLLKIPGLAIPIYDYVARVLTNSTTETYTFRSGGSGGTVVATVVVVYTDSTLGTLLTVTKT